MADELKKDAMDTDPPAATAAAAPAPAPVPVDPAVAQRRQVLADYRRKLLEHRELEAKVRSCMFSGTIIRLFDPETHVYVVSQNIRSARMMFEHLQNNVSFRVFDGWFIQNIPF